MKMTKENKRCANINNDKFKVICSSCGSENITICLYLNNIHVQIKCNECQNEDKY